MKKFISCIVVFILMFVLASCGTQKPDAVVSKFCDALKAYDYETLQTYLANEDDENEILETFDKDSVDETDILYDFIKNKAAEMKYSIEKSTINEDETATVTVNFDYVDTAPVISATFLDYISQALTLAFSGQEDTDFEELINNIFEEKKNSIEIKNEKVTVDIKCIKVDGEWKIDELPDEVVDVATCNLSKVLNDLIGKYK